MGLGDKMSILGMTSYVMLFLVFECIVSGFFVVFTFPLTELKSEEESLGAAGSSDCTTGPRDRIKERKEGTKIGLDSWFWIVFVVLHILQKEKFQKASQYCWQQLTSEAVEDSERGKLMGWLMLLGKLGHVMIGHQKMSAKLPEIAATRSKVVSSWGSRASRSCHQSRHECIMFSFAIML